MTLEGHPSLELFIFVESSPRDKLRGLLNRTLKVLEDCTRWFGITGCLSSCNNRRRERKFLSNEQCWLKESLEANRDRNTVCKKTCRNNAAGIFRIYALCFGFMFMYYLCTYQ